MGKKREGFVLLVLDLNYLNHWEINLAKRFPDAKFIIHFSNPEGNNACSGLLKIENADYLEIKKYLSKYSLARAIKNMKEIPILWEFLCGTLNGAQNIDTKCL